MLPRRALLPLLIAAATTPAQIARAHIARAQIAHAQAGPPMDVLASFSVLADFVRAIGGARVRVRALVGPDQDTHSFQPRPSDTRAVAAANLLVVNGLALEGWIDRLARSAGFKGTMLVATSGIAQRGADPHAWQDVANAKIYARNIGEALAQADPANASTFTQAATAYLGELDRLDSDIRASWAAIPRAARRIVTSHDAFGYYAAAYGVDFLAPQGIAADSEPTPRQLAVLIGQIRAEKIRAVFIENISNPQILRQVARETGAVIGPAVYSDALSAPTGPAGSYLDMMRHNTRSFVAALR